MRKPVLDGFVGIGFASECSASHHFPVETMIGAQTPYFDVSIDIADCRYPQQAHLYCGLHAMLTVEYKIMLLIKGDRLGPDALGLNFPDQPIHPPLAEPFDMPKAMHRHSFDLCSFRSNHPD